MRSRAPAPLCLALFWALAAPGRTLAQDPPPPLDRGLVGLAPVRTEAEAGEVATALTEALADSTAQALGESGFHGLPIAIASIPDKVPGYTEDATAARRATLDSARAEGAGWAATLHLAVEAGRATARIALYDTASGALVAAEGFSTVAGPTALPLLGDAARRAAARLAAASKLDLSGPLPAGAYGILLEAKGGEAEIESLAAGLLASGEVLFVAFAKEASPLEAGTDGTAVAPGAADVEALAAGCRVRLAIETTTAADGSPALAFRLSDAAGLGAPTGGLLAPAGTGEPRDLRAGQISGAATGFLATGLPRILVRIKGRPGTRFTGGGQEGELSSSGDLEFELSLPLPFAWKAESPGAYAEAGKLDPRRKRELRIPERLWGLELGAEGLGFPELRLALALGSHCFARAALTEYLGGLGPGARPAGTLLPSFQSLALLEPRLGFGFGILPRASDFRPYLALDAFLRLATWSGAPSLLDGLAPVGLDLSAGLEWGRGASLRLWGEAGATLYPWADPLRLYASLGGRPAARLVAGGASLFAGHPGWFAELPTLRVGLRYSP